MQDDIQSVRDYYDSATQKEWARLDENPFEFTLTTWMMDRYIRPGDRILDIGGGPGRYSIHYAAKGCDVTLVDLSEGNIALAKQQAAAANVAVKAYTANCLELDALPLETYDHVFLMGPLYHLVREEDRIAAVQAALQRLRPDGYFYASFILAFSGIIYDLQHAGYLEADLRHPEARKLVDKLVDRDIYTGPAFTTACFYHQSRIEPFMAQFPLRKLHLFGQEGILAPNKYDLIQRTPEEQETWIALAKRLLEQPELLAYSEHAMYIGQK